MGLYYQAVIVYGAKGIGYDYDKYENTDLDYYETEDGNILGKNVIRITEDDVCIGHPLKLLSKDDEKEVEEVIGCKCEYLVILQLD
jgi:hypothetical protein